MATTSANRTKVTAPSTEQPTTTLFQQFPGVEKAFGDTRMSDESGATTTVAQQPIEYYYQEDDEEVSAAKRVEKKETYLVGPLNSVWLEAVVSEEEVNERSKALKHRYLLHITFQLTGNKQVSRPQKLHTVYIGSASKRSV